jgi:hypothetical protein
LVLCDSHLRLKNRRCEDLSASLVEICMVEEAVVEVVERLLVVEVVLRSQHRLFLRICTYKILLCPWT